LRDQERKLTRQRLTQLEREAEADRWAYRVATLEGSSDTWPGQLSEWRRDGWELISVVQEDGAYRAVLERRI
jgi:hypothetical protein